MGLYSKRILPKLTHFVCDTKPSRRQREKVIPLAEGCVLEIGIGSGLNLPFYDPDRVSRIWGLDPSLEMLRMAEAKAAQVAIDVELLAYPAEEIPLDSASVDTVTTTYTLCSIPETGLALREVSRVLKPGGRLIFCEHGVAPDASVRRWQDRLDPVWGRFSGGCHLNRAIPDLIEKGGFRIRQIDTMYLPGWRPGSFNYWGSAMA